MSSDNYLGKRWAVLKVVKMGKQREAASVA
jgi:hypothetical protein